MQFFGARLPPLPAPWIKEWNDEIVLKEPSRANAGFPLGN